ncbi:hypothetical protein F2Q69_00031211 [Brassica cretica]|uniref:Uncharacterized protein n=1 Tax=Brassica cretica TaxID=69181 RepID=A0A8S9RXX5_BRACR|nr:hypothetical protein F2Q69_00031211 [Brassica cretica]
MSEKPTSVIPISDNSRSRNTVHDLTNNTFLDLTNFKVLPPKTSSPIQTNKASCSSNLPFQNHSNSIPTIPPPAHLPTPKPNIVLPPNPTCVPPEPVLPPQPSHPPPQ